MASDRQTGVVVTILPDGSSVLVPIEGEGELTYDPLAPAENEVADFDPYEGREPEISCMQKLPSGKWIATDEAGTSVLPEWHPEGGWAEIVGTRTLVATKVAEFGFGEETLALMKFEGGQFEVGIGESLRPYRLRYLGSGQQAAERAFDAALAELKQL